MKNLQGNRLLIVALFLMSGLLLGFKATVAPSKITVCHVPPGNPSNCHEISVSTNALQAHLDHGDDLICHDEDELEVYVKIYRDFIVSAPTATNLLITGTGF